MNCAFIDDDDDDGEDNANDDVAVVVCAVVDADGIMSVGMHENKGEEDENGRRGATRRCG